MDHAQYREHLQGIFSAGLKAVDPFESVTRAVERKGEEILVGKRSYHLKDYDRILVVGAGKAGAPMALAMEKILGDRLSAGRVTVKYDHGLHTEKVEIEEAAQSGDRTGLRVHADRHEETGRWIIRVVDTSTGQTVREFPPVDLLDAMAALDDLGGTILEEEM